MYWLWDAPLTHDKQGKTQDFVLKKSKWETHDLKPHYKVCQYKRGHCFGPNQGLLEREHTIYRFD